MGDKSPAVERDYRPPSDHKQDETAAISAAHPEIRDLLTTNSQKERTAEPQKEDTALSFDTARLYENNTAATIVDFRPETAGEKRAEERVNDPRFHEDLRTLEKRSDISEEEKRGTLEAVRKLLEPDPDARLSAEQRERLAKDIVRLAANPGVLDQGDHNTCVVASVESRVYRREPSRAAALVAEVATTGAYTDSTGTRIELDQNSLRPDSEARLDPPEEGKRSFASQLFQVTAVNDIYRHTGHRAGLRYEQHEAEGPGDTGERVFDTRKNPPELVGKNDPRLFKSDKSLAYKLITGHDAERANLGISGETDFEHGEFKTEEDLGRILLDLKARGELPAMLGINAGNEPFYSDQSAGSFNLGDGGHALTVLDYDPDTGMVKVDNQWGKSKDHIDKPISLRDVYAATLDPSQAWEYKLGNTIDRDYPDLSLYQRQLKVYSSRLDASPKSRDYLGFEVGQNMSRVDSGRRQNDPEQDRDRTDALMHEALDKLTPEQQLVALNVRLEYSYDTPANSERHSPYESGFRKESEFYNDAFLKAVRETGLAKGDLESELAKQLASEDATYNPTTKETLTVYSAANFLSKLPPAERDRLLARIFN